MDEPFEVRSEGEEAGDHEEDYSEFESLMAIVPHDSARELFELLADGSELHVSQIASRIGGTSLSVSLLRNAVNRAFEQSQSDLYIHSEFRPKIEDRPLGIYYCLTRSS
jgi:DNA-binding transcriptional ArsR family regulator